MGIAKLDYLIMYFAGEVAGKDTGYVGDSGDGDGYEGECVNDETADEMA